MGAMSVLHRAVFELSELTTFHKPSARSVRRIEHAQHRTAASSHADKEVTVSGHALVEDARANRLHQAICALAEVVTFTRPRA